MQRETRPNRYPGSLVLLAAAGLLAWGSAVAELADFCRNLPRPAYSSLQKHPASNDWFEVYEVEPGVFAIYEPFQWQEVISYLVLGDERALLFDTGNGLGDIKAVVDSLTTLPVTVLNSHTHFDHIGGNHAFADVLSLATPFSLGNSQGLRNAMISMEASPEALCKGLPPGVTRSEHWIRPYEISGTVKDGDMIDLGGRRLEVLQVPGHTVDAIALLDRQNGLLWTGDTFYEGPIWLFFPETDLAAYRQSIRRLGALAPKLRALLPAHNTPHASPALLQATVQAFEEIVSGKASGSPEPGWEGVLRYGFEGFGFLLREDYHSLP